MKLPLNIKRKANFRNGINYRIYRVDVVGSVVDPSTTLVSKNKGATKANRVEYQSVDVEHDGDEIHLLFQYVQGFRVVLEDEGRVLVMVEGAKAIPKEAVLLARLLILLFRVFFFVFISKNLILPFLVVVFLDSMLVVVLFLSFNFKVT